MNLKKIYTHRNEVRGLCQLIVIGEEQSVWVSLMHLIQHGFIKLRILGLLFIEPSVEVLVVHIPVSKSEGRKSASDYPGAHSCYAHKVKNLNR